MILRNLTLQKFPFGSSKKLKISFSVLFLFISLTSFAQQTINGTVTDEEGVPLIGVTVLEKGTGNGVVTDFNGNFEISTNGNDAVLVFSYIGFRTKEVPVENQNQLDVILEEDMKALSEIVVIGYGTQEKADVTSAVATVDSEDFVQGAVKDAAQLIQGKVAGLSVSAPSGDPTAGTQIMLRGISSIYGNTSPLILVDGVPGSLETVAPQNIASISVLKDGSATAIYGTRGTNGVIIITTKDASGVIEPTINYTGYVSLSQISGQLDFLSADELRQKWEEGYEFTGANLEDFGASTDWVDEITRDAVSTVHNLIFRAGNEKSDVTASLNYTDNEGIFINSENVEYTGRIDVNHSMFDNKLNSNFRVIVSEQSYLDFNDYVYRQALIRNPTEPVKNEDGTWFERDVYFYDNPVAYIKETDQEHRNRNMQFTGSLTYSPNEHFDIQGMFTRKGNSGIHGYYETKNHVSTTKNGIEGYASRSTSDYIGNFGQFTVDYNGEFGNHKITALAGYNYEDNTYEGFNANNRQFPTDAYSFNNLGVGQGLPLGEAGMDSYKYSDKLIAFFGRVTYNYDDRYLLMASIRHEGSSRFGENHKWGTFPGISLGWRINEESFMENVEWINQLKLRGGFGVTGINAGSNYQSLASLNYSNYFLYNNRWIRELVPVRNPNPNLKWERKEEFNVGLDFGFFKGRLSGALDYYNRTTNDVLYYYDVPVPPYLYGTIYSNVAQLANSGFEALINTIPIQTDSFTWNSSLTYSTNKNELVSLSNDQFQSTNDYFYEGYTGEPIQIATHRVEVGESIGNFYGLKSVGITEDGVFLIETPEGEVVPATETSAADRQVIGNGLPKHYANWNNEFRYGNWDLNIGISGAFDYQILNFARMFYENPTIQYNVLDTAFDEVYGKAVLSDVQRYVSYYLEDGDYVKIDNATLGYTFDVSSLNFIKVLRIYVSGLNLYTFTDYSGVDPEVNRMGLAPGIDHRDTYPSTRTYTLGINLTF